MKNKKTKEQVNYEPEPWWFWGCSKESYYESFNKSLSDTIMEEDSRVNQKAWAEIENA